MSEYVVVTTISTFRHRYVMHRDDLQALNTESEVNPVEWAKDTVTCEECEEFSQLHLGEEIVDAHEMSEAEMLQLFDRDNDYLKNWTEEHKIEWVRKNLSVGAKS